MSEHEEYMAAVDAEATAFVEYTSARSRWEAASRDRTAAFHAWRRAVDIDTEPGETGE